MVEILLLVVVIIGIRAIYLWFVRGAEDAKAFVEHSSNEIGRVMGCLAMVSLFILAAIIMMLAS